MKQNTYTFQAQMVPVKIQAYTEDEAEDTLIQLVLNGDVDVEGLHCSDVEYE